MKSKGKKFLSALLVSSMVLTSSIGFMPRTAQAVGNSEVYSYDFEYENEITQVGNRKIVLEFEEELTSIDSTKFSIVGDTTASIGMVDPDTTNNKVEIVIDGIDPSELDYTLEIEVGGLVFSDYQQLEPFTINFKSYDITPGFKSIFRNTEEANKLFSDNEGAENIILHSDSDYITDISATSVSGQNWTTIGVSTLDEVDSVVIEIQDLGEGNRRKVDTLIDDKYSSPFAGITGMQMINVTAYDQNGKKLDFQSALNKFGEPNGTNFDTETVNTFDTAGYKVSDILNGTVDIATVIGDRSYNELNEINVQYNVADNIFTVSSVSELANALSSIKKLTGKTATIKLDADIAVSSEVVFENDERLTIKGNGHTITGNIQLGNDNDKEVKLVNTNIVGNVEVHVGDAGDASITDVNITDGNLVVTSGDYTSLMLTRVTVAKMLVANLDSNVHIIAVTGTAIGTTELTGTKKVKLTMAGGTFGADILDKMTSAELVLESNKNEGQVFDQLTISADATSPTVRLLENTKVMNLVANEDVTMTGHSSSEVATSATSTKKITYNGFVIADATSDTDKYVGTDVPSGSGSVSPTVNVPSSNINKIKLGGTLLDGLNATEVNAGNGYLTLTLEGNMIWLAGLDDEAVFNIGDLVVTETITGGGGTTVVTDADYEIERLSDKVLKLKWDPDADIVAGDKTVVKIDATKFTKDLFTPDASIIGTTVWADAYEGSDFDTLYRPATEGTNEFVVYAEADLDAIRLAANLDLSAVTVHNVSADFEYRTNTGDWAALADAVDISGDFADGGGTLEIRVTNGDGTVKPFELVDNEPWFRGGAGDAANLRLALVNPNVNLIHFSDEEAAYNFSTGVDLTKAEADILKDKAYSSDGMIFKREGADTGTAAIAVTTTKGVNGSYLDITGTGAGTDLTVTADTTAPAIATAAFTNATTLVLTFDEPVVAVAGDFTDGKHNGAGAKTFTVDSMTGSGTTVITLTVTGTDAIASPNTGTVDIAGTVLDLAGNAVTPVDDQAITGF